MRYILQVVLEGFYVRHLVGEREGPLAIVREATVLDANLPARKRGVSVGMEARTARAVAHEIELVPWEAEPFERAQEQWLDLCTEFTGIIEPEDQHSAYLDLSGHPNPTDVAERLIRVLVAQTGLHVRYGAASSKWLAKLSAEVGDCAIAIRNPKEFLSELPVSRLNPVRSSCRERLGFLGYRTVGQILEIPAAVLRQQFGQEAMRIVGAAKGELSDPVQPLYPRDSLIEAVIFEGPVESLETIDLALQNLSQRIGQRLLTKGLQGQELELAIELEEDQVKVRRRRFSKPVFNPLSALASLRLLLGSPNASVCSLRVRMWNLEKVKEKQHALLGVGRSHDLSAFHYVRSVFGDRAVQLASEVSVPRRVRVLREWKNATGWY